MPAFNENSFEGEMLWGTFYPKGYLVAAMHRRAQADDASAELERDGFTEVRIWTGQEVLERHAAFLAQRNMAQRVGAHFDSDERAALDEYLQAARQDHIFLTVHVPDQHQVDRVHATLVEHEAHLMHYYTAVGMADLPARLNRLPAGTQAERDQPETPAAQVDPSDSQRDLIP